MKADLHIHSIYSDGENTPKQIAEIAKSKEIKLLSLTDHDTVDGNEEMHIETTKLGIEFITGIELSAFTNKEIHILGYNVDICNKIFTDKLNQLKILRKSRLNEILKKLKKIGIIITEEEVLKQTAIDNSIGRMHIAKALMLKGYVDCVNDAFTKWLGYGKAAYVSSYRLKPSEAIALINLAGGKAVLAHPSQIDIEQQNLYPLLKEMILNGLSGIEAQYSAHTTAENNYYLKIAKELNLISTCGSDFHGITRPISIEGYQLGEEDYKRLKS